MASSNFWRVGLLPDRKISAHLKTFQKPFGCWAKKWAIKLASKVASGLVPDGC